MFNLGMRLPPAVNVALGVVVIVAGLVAGNLEVAIVGGVVLAVTVLRVLVWRR